MANEKDAQTEMSKEQKAILKKLLKLMPDAKMFEPRPGGTYYGPVVATDKNFVAQQVGDGTVVAHPKSALALPDGMKLKAGQVVSVEHAKDVSQGVAPATLQAADPSRWQERVARTPASAEHSAAAREVLGEKVGVYNAPAPDKGLSPSYQGVVAAVTEDGHLIQRINSRTAIVHNVGPDVAKQFGPGQEAVIRYDNGQFKEAQAVERPKAVDVAREAAIGKGIAEKLGLTIEENPSRINPNIFPADHKFGTIGQEGWGYAHSGKSMKDMHADIGRVALEAMSRKELGPSGEISAENMAKVREVVADVDQRKSRTREARSPDDAARAASWVLAKNITTKSYGTDVKLYSASRVDSEAGKFRGPIVAMTDHHVVQRVGQGKSFVVHAREDLSGQLQTGRFTQINYDHGKAHAQAIERGQQRGQDQAREQGKAQEQGVRPALAPNRERQRPGQGLSR